jgi:hypothetical protein
MNDAVLASSVRGRDRDCEILGLLYLVVWLALAIEQLDLWQ